MSKQVAISWLLHSIKILLGDESIRRYIIVQYFTNLKYKSKKHIRTFDPFIKKGTRQDKFDKITKYLESIENLKKDIVVFTATHVQQDINDNETHFQSFIVNNETKQVWVIDPALNKLNANLVGIYYPEITHELIKPHFEKKGYTVQFIQLSNPAQTTTDDVFCQSWSLMILLQILTNNNYTKNKEYIIPFTQEKKYEMLLNFYKKIFTENPELQDNLKIEYEGSVKELLFAKDKEKRILDYNPFVLLQNMTQTDMCE